MLHSRLLGPFPLSADAIAKHVPEDAPGAYALGFETGAVFTVLFVGRADASLRDSLLERVREGRRLSFKYMAVDSVHNAFDMECVLFHEFGGARHLENTAHPERPTSTRWLCPECAHYGIRDWAALAR